MGTTLGLIGFQPDTHEPMAMLSELTAWCCKDPSHTSLTDLRSMRVIGRRAPSNALEPKNNSELINGVHPLLPSIRRGGGTTVRPRLRCPEGEGVQPWQ